MAQTQGVVIGLCAAVLGIAGVGYGYYVKQVDYVPVQGRIAEARKQCFQYTPMDRDLDKKGRKFMPSASDERPCPRPLFEADKDDYEISNRMVRFTVISISYVSPVDGKPHLLHMRKKSNASDNALQVGQPFALRAHKNRSDDALVDGWMPGLVR